MSETFEDQASPCPCPKPVIELLALAVRYVEASLAGSHPDVLLGAEYVKTFMEQPAEVWCAYLVAREEEA